MRLKIIIPFAVAVLGLAACSDESGTTAKEPAPTSPMASPATSAPTNPVTGTVPGTNGTGASPTATGGGN